MASTFTLFPRLPCELRLQVWELALRPFSTHKGGLNYISVIGKDDEDEAGTKSLTLIGWRDSPEPGIQRGARLQCIRAQNGVSSNPMHRSACLWDSGLLTACKESRRVIMRRYKNYKQSTQRTPWTPAEPWWYGDRYQSPSIAYTPGRDEDWYILVQKNKDLPCFNFQNWDSLYASPPDWRGPFRYSCNLKDPSCPLALEFDASWILNWPGKDFEIFDEASPRGLLARVLESHLGDLDECSIWLIDRYATPLEMSGSQETPCRTFYDMDQDYVESTDVSVEVSEFLDKLDRLISCCDFDRIEGISEYDWDPDEDFEMDKCVKVLVRTCGK